MVGPLDLLAVIGTLATGIQSFFTWSAYNRDTLGFNVTWRQMQLYQKRNYYKFWVSFAREDLEDMKEVSVHHTSNYLMVSTMMLSSTILAFAVAGFSSDCPTFVVFAFYTSGATAAIFLMLAIMFGIKSQASAYENTMHVYTSKLRCWNPSVDTHDYMSQTQLLEKGGMSSMCRQPGAHEDYGLTTADKHLAPPKPKKKAKKLAPNVINIDDIPELIRNGGVLPSKEGNKGSGASSSKDPPPEEASKDKPPLEMVPLTDHGKYLSTFEELMHLWKPHEDCCKICMGLGTVSFAQSSAYFTIGKVAGHTEHYLEELLCLTVTVAFVYVMMVILAGFKNCSRLFRSILLAIVVGGHGCGAVASATTDHGALAVLVPLAFALHFLFWFVVFVGCCCSADEQQSEDDAAEAGTSTQKGADEAEHEDDEGHKTPEQKQKEAEEEDKAKKEAIEDGSDPFLTKKDLEGYRIRRERKQKLARRAICFASAACCSMWLSLTGWAIARYAYHSYELLESLQRIEASKKRLVGVEKLAVQWPSPLYHPHSIACASGSVFTADRYNIFQVFPWGNAPAVKVDCDGLRGGRIESVSVACRGERCHPLALVRRSNGVSFVNCTSATSMAGISQTTKYLAAVQVLDDSDGADPKLLTSRAGDLVQYERADQSAPWQSRWTLGRLSEPADLRSIASSGNFAMLFYTARAAASFVDVLDLQTGKSDGHWSAPAAALSGCAIGDRSVLLLASEAGRPVIRKATLS
eukprot:TRINITY_DN28860_c2_g1_i1.p1 TRINITY_DN28860_c2_g1~~TRINITY_DN28860_c2_g1_i1.p1  ORF type:complete len:748 (+),score=86.23 TRINITY_DN28860_c2_g1_i1:59-2302(+)